MTPGALVLLDDEQPQRPSLLERASGKRVTRPAKKLLPSDRELKRRRAESSVQEWLDAGDRRFALAQALDTGRQVRAVKQTVQDAAQELTEHFRSALRHPNAGLSAEQLRVIEEELTRNHESEHGPLRRHLIMRVGPPMPEVPSSVEDIRARRPIKQGATVKTIIRNQAGHIVQVLEEPVE